MAMIKVREVEARPGYRLALRFSDGTAGEVDFRPFLERRAFASVRDRAVFSKAFVEHGAVTWPGDIAIAAERLYAAAHALPAPKTLEQAKANELEMSLRELRKLAGVTQEQTAEAMGMDQGQLSRFERSEDRLTSTLKRYVEALGGELQLVAKIGDVTVKIRGF